VWLATSTVIIALSGPLYTYLYRYFTNFTVEQICGSIVLGMFLFRLVRRNSVLTSTFMWQLYFAVR
jgi:hypothetical protein